MYKRHNITLTSASLVRVIRVRPQIEQLDAGALTCCKRRLARWEERRIKSSGLTRITFHCLHCGRQYYHHTPNAIGTTRNA